MKRIININLKWNKKTQRMTCTSDVLCAQCPLSHCCELLKDKNMLTNRPTLNAEVLDAPIGEQPIKPIGE